jgi:hypothetical protein
MAARLHGQLGSITTRRRCRCGSDEHALLGVDVDRLRPARLDDNILRSSYAPTAVAESPW